MLLISVRGLQFTYQCLGPPGNLSGLGAIRLLISVVCQQFTYQC